MAIGILAVISAQRRGDVPMKRYRRPIVPRPPPSPLCPLPGLSYPGIPAPGVALAFDARKHDLERRRWQLDAVRPPHARHAALPDPRRLLSSAMAERSVNRSQKRILWSASGPVRLCSCKHLAKPANRIGTTARPASYLTQISTNIPRSGTLIDSPVRLRFRFAAAPE